MDIITRSQLEHKHKFTYKRIGRTDVWTKPWGNDGAYLCVEQHDIMKPSHRVMVKIVKFNESIVVGQEVDVRKVVGMEECQMWKV